MCRHVAWAGVAPAVVLLGWIPTIKAAEAPVVSTEVLAQREIDRRQNATTQFTQVLEWGDRLYRSGEWERAISKYREVQAQTQMEGPTAGLHRRAVLGVAKSLTAQSMAKEKDGQIQEAAGLMRQALELDPDNRALAKQSQSLQEKAARLADPYPGNPAVTDDLLAKTAEIKRLLSLSDQLVETGQYLAARAKLDDVLRLDPYHRVARKKIEELEDRRMRAADRRYEASREKALAKVSEAWLPPPPAVVDPGRVRGTGASAVSRAGEILKMLAAIQIPELVFNEKPIRAAIEELQRLSQEYDPAKKGLNFVLRLPAPSGDRDPEAANISLELRNIPLQVALRYICDQVRGGDKLRFEVEDNAVLILPVTETGGELQTRTYNLPSGLLTNVDQKDDDQQKLGTAILRNIGANVEVKGAFATFYRDTGKLVVRNTPSELNKIEVLIRNAEGEPPQKQFEIETKFLQFTENDVKNFTFNLAMQMYQNSGNPRTGSFAPGAPGLAFSPSGGGGTDGLRGTAGLNQNGVSVVALQNLLDPTFPQDASNQIGINTQVLGRGVSAFLQLLQNALGKDLVAAPRVTLADGKESKIVISRQMFYPTSYTQPTVPNNDQGLGAGFILPSNPTGFESRNLGVTLIVKGESTAIPKAVDLDFIDLMVEDFEGFVDYGAQIGTVSFGNSPTVTGSLNTVNPVPVPVGSAPFLVPIFSKRSLQSRVRLLDGETVALGGLIAESLQAVDDKVPGLGDVPLFGRLFRSEASQKIKSNLVIFCTLRIINPDGSLRFSEDEENPEFAQGGGAEMMPSVP